MSILALERSDSYSGNTRFHRTVVVNPAVWEVFNQNDILSKDLIPNFNVQNMKDFETMYAKNT